MPTTIFFSAPDADAVHGTAHALLKYLDVYNLKPPKDHSVVIHTTQPAALETYGTFFHRFELHPPVAESEAPLAFLQRAAAYYEGGLLWLAPHAYPVAPLEPLLRSLAKGLTFGRKSLRRPAKAGAPGFSAIGFASAQRGLAAERLVAGVPGAEAIDLFEDLNEFRLLLRRFFSKYQEESVPNQVKLMHPIDARDIAVQKQRFQQLPFYTRWARKVMGTGWGIEQYTRKF